MKINLIPISHPELNSIEIDSNVFLVSRLDEPFVSLATEITKDLSRQHAKIVIKDERINIIDCNSLNGTTLNNQALSEYPAPVNNGDIIEFANSLAYKVKIETPDPDITVLAAKKQELYLKLTPVNRTSGLDILVITSFPFIISKEVGVFPSFAQEFATEIRHISRRHAQIISTNNALKLVDMSSTNSTFINSQPLKNATPVTLKNEDIIAFAGDFFVYSITLMNQHEVIADATVLSAGSGKPDKTQLPVHPTINEVQLKTTFVSDPGSFLDILCSQIESKHTAEKAIIKQKGKVKNKPEKYRYKLYYLILASFAVLIATAFLYFTDVTPDISSLIHSGRYSEAAEQADRSLKQHPDDIKLRRLFNQEMLNQLIPEWLNILNQGEYQKANQFLLNAKNNTLDSQSLISSINLLQWMGDVQQFMFIQNYQRGIEIYEDEKILNDLLSFWNKNKTENRKNFAELARLAPEFQPLYEQVLSNIRILEHSRDVDLKAFSLLQETLFQHLKSTSSAAEILNLVTQFEQKYPKVIGLDRLKQDISHYADLNKALNNKDLETYETLAKQYHYQTPFFVTSKHKILLKKFPAHEFSKLYSAATESWQTGKFDLAIETMSTLQKRQDGRWKELTQYKLAHYQRVIKGYKALQAVQGSAKYINQLLSFQSVLQQPGDDYFVLLTQKDFKTHERLFQENAHQEFIQAQNFWNAYFDNRGINGSMRLEAEISNNFINQAENLSSAFNHISASLQYYDTMDKNQPREVFQLFITIKKELEKQRLRLTDLEFIISTKLLVAKLSLLTKPVDFSEQQ